MLKKLLAKLVGSTGKKRSPKKAALRKKAAGARRPAKRKPAARLTTQKPPRKAAKRAAASKKREAPAPPPGAGREIGRVIAFFRIPVVAVIKVTQGSITVGDRIWIKGHTTNLKQTVASMQINHKPVQKISEGDEAGIQVSSRARRGDRVYQL